MPLPKVAEIEARKPAGKGKMNETGAGSITDSRHVPSSPPKAKISAIEDPRNQETRRQGQSGFRQRRRGRKCGGRPARRRDAKELPLDVLMCLPHHARSEDLCFWPVPDTAPLLQG
jgi:hypothetical protein